MGRLSPIQRFHRDMIEVNGSKAVTTEKGKAVYDRGRNFNNDSQIDILSAALRSEGSIEYENPTRNKFIAMLVQEMYAVSSIFSRGIIQGGYDAGQDSSADSQPHMIMVNGENEYREEKIIEILNKAFLKADLGLNTPERITTGLLNGVCYVQPIFEYDGLKWHFTKAKHMPSWEIIEDPVTGKQMQIRLDSNGRNSLGFGETVLGQWDIPGWLGKTIPIANRKSLYGTPVGELVIVDYKLMVMSIEDVSVSSRSNAPLRLVYTIGEMGRTPEPKLVEDFKVANQQSEISIVRNLYLRQNYEKVEAIKGNAAGSEALLKICKFHQNNMRRAIGLPPEPENLNGPGQEEVDAVYARTINAWRMADSRCLKSIGDKVLQLEGYSDVDWYPLIPPIGETETNRVGRISKELSAGHIGHKRYCAEYGIKNLKKYREDIKETAAFYKSLGLTFGENPIKASADRGSGDPNTDSPKKGKDTQTSRVRRNNERKQGRQPTGA